MSWTNDASQSQAYSWVTKNVDNRVEYSRMFALADTSRNPPLALVSYIVKNLNKKVFILLSTQHSNNKAVAAH